MPAYRRQYQVKVIKQIKKLQLTMKVTARYIVDGVLPPPPPTPTPDLPPLNSVYSVVQLVEGMLPFPNALASLQTRKQNKNDDVIYAVDMTLQLTSRVGSSTNAYGPSFLYKSAHTKGEQHHTIYTTRQN